MKYYAASRLSVFDVKWTNLFVVNELFDAYHYNPYYELIMVSEGPVYLQVEKENLILNTGEIFLLDQWEKHRGWRKTEGTSAFFWVQFSCNPKMKELDTSTKPIQDYKILHAERNELRTMESKDADLLLIPRRFKPEQRYKLLSCFEQMLNEMKHPVGYFRFRLTQLLCKILELISTDLLEQTAQNLTPPSTYLTYRELVNFLNDFYQTKLNKEAVEKKMGLSYEYLSQVFKKYSGITIVSYIHQLRVQRAKFLLENTELPVVEIAKEIGFDDPFYFSKIFKKMEGMSPTQYRNIHGKDPK